MTAVLVILASVCSAILGRLLIGRWYNHLSLYALGWGVALLFYQFDLIHYYPITPAAWGYIGVAWVAFLAGTATVRFTSNEGPVEATGRKPAASHAARLAILALCLLAATTLAYQWLYLLRRYGTVATAVLAGAAERYQMRVAGDVEGQVPYVGALALTACVVAGAYAKRAGRLGLLSLLPLIVVGLGGITAAGRTGIGIGAILFLSGLLVTPSPGAKIATSAPRPPGTRLSKRLRQVAGGLVLVVAAAGSFSLISATRGLQVDLPGVDPAMHRLSRYLPFAPSLYAHLSVSPVAFSEYLKAGAPTQGLGGYTLAPVRRVLARVGLSSSVPYYEENYFTPVPANVGTYLKNVYADFGPAGVVWFPFLLAGVATWLAWRYRGSDRLLPVMVLAHLYAVVVFSFTFNIMVLGDWLVSLAGGCAVALLLDRSAAALAAPLRPQ